LNLALIILYL